MTVPPTYPRIPHLSPGRGTRDDLILTDSDRGSFLNRELIVEEKLDGANVVIWREGSVLDCSLRSGPGSADRAGQLGPLKAWVAQHIDALAYVLDSWSGLYGEWLFLAHTVLYDRLESLLVVLDLWHESRGFASVGERNQVCGEAHLAVPPELWKGVPGCVEPVESTLDGSRYGDVLAEGIILRPLDNVEPRIAKVLNPAFHQITDEEWAKGRPRNRVAAGIA